MAGDRGRGLAIAGALAAVFALLLAIGAAGNGLRGNSYLGGLGLLVLGLAAGAVALAVWLSQKRIELLFRKKDPDAAIAYYEAAGVRARARGARHAEFATACHVALAATVYGRFAEARSRLNGGEWIDAPEYFQQRRATILGLAEVMAGSRYALGADQSLLALAVAVASGGADGVVLKRVQKAAFRGSGPLPAVCAWAVSRECVRRGQPKEAGEFLRRARECVAGFPVQGFDTV